MIFLKQATLREDPSAARGRDLSMNASQPGRNARAVSRPVPPEKHLSHDPHERKRSK